MQLMHSMVTIGGVSWLFTSSHVFSNPLQEPIRGDLGYHVKHTGDIETTLHKPTSSFSSSVEEIQQKSLQVYNVIEDTWGPPPQKKKANFFSSPWRRCGCSAHLLKFLLDIGSPLCVDPYSLKL